MNQSQRSVGIDVSKDRLDIFVLPDNMSWSVPNDQPSVSALVERLRSLAPAWIVLEATGGFENSVLVKLCSAGLPAVRVNPRNVRSLAKGLGKLAKTDKIDAQLLASYGPIAKPRIAALKPEDLRELTDLVARRQQLIEMLVAEKNRRQSASGVVRRDIEANISWLEKRIESMDSDLENRIKTTPSLQIKAELLRSTPGVGRVFCAVCLSNLPELGQITGKEISALVGVAPFNCDSGRFRGKRLIWGGRANIRCALYMATLSATRCNPVIREFYKRLLDAGKAKKLAITACMRKLLVILNAMVRTGTFWEAPVKS